MGRQPLPVETGLVAIAHNPAITELWRMLTCQKDLEFPIPSIPKGAT